MLDSLSPRRRRFALTSAAVAVVITVATVGIVVAVHADDAPPVSQRELGPVLVVPGYGGNMVAIDPIVRALREQGREAVAVRPIGAGDGDLHAQADRLSDVATRLMGPANAKSVDVVGYSAGGVVARLWAAGDGGRLARRVITIGSPHHGTDTAAVAEEIAGSCSLACEQLVPDSDLLRELNAGDETPAGPAWISIASTADQTVTPTATSRLEGALNILVQDVCPGRETVHGALPSDPVVVATLKSVLGRGRPTVPSDVSC